MEKQFTCPVCGKVGIPDYITRFAAPNVEQILGYSD